MPSDVLDEQMVAALRAFGRGPSSIVSDTMRDFLVEAPSLLDRIERAAEAGDSPAVGRLGHRLKGTSGIMGASRLASACDTVERSAQTGDAGSTRDGIAAAREELELAVQAVRRMLEEEQAAAPAPWA